MELPLEIIDHIIDYLDVTDIVNMPCKLWYGLFKRNRLFLHKLKYINSVIASSFYRFSLSEKNKFKNGRVKLIPSVRYNCIFTLFEFIPLHREKHTKSSRVRMISDYSYIINNDIGTSVIDSVACSCCIYNKYAYFDDSSLTSHKYTRFCFKKKYPCNIISVTVQKNTTHPDFDVIAKELISDYQFKKEEDEYFIRYTYFNGEFSGFSSKYLYEQYLLECDLAI